MVRGGDIPKLKLTGLSGNGNRYKRGAFSIGSMVRGGDIPKTETDWAEWEWESV